MKTLSFALQECTDRSVLGAPLILAMLVTFQETRPASSSMIVERVQAIMVHRMRDAVLQSGTGIDDGG